MSVDIIHVPDGLMVGNVVNPEDGVPELLVGGRTGRVGEYFVETISFRSLGDSGVCSYLSVWRWIAGDEFRLVWGPSELGMAYRDNLQASPEYGPVEPELEAGSADPRQDMDR